MANIISPQDYFLDTRLSITEANGNPIECWLLHEVLHVMR